MITEAAWGGWTASLPAAAGSTAGWDVPIDGQVAAAVAIHDPDRLRVPERPVVHRVAFG